MFHRFAMERIVNAQLSLDYSDSRQGSHRKRDRQSSVDAARSMSGSVLRAQQRLVLTRLSWVLDANAYEVSQSLNVQQNVVARRFDDLEEMGLAARTGTKRVGSSSRQCDVWAITRKGLRWLDGMVDVVDRQERV